MSLRISPWGANSNFFTLASYSEKRIAFQARVRGTRSYDVTPTEGFIDQAQNLLLKVHQLMVDNNFGRMQIDWAEADGEDEDVNAVLQRKIGRCGHIVLPLTLNNFLFAEPFDPFAKERYPWLIVKSGYETVAARDGDRVCTTIANIVNMLSRFLLLQKAPLYCCLSCAVNKKVLDDIQDFIRTPKTKKIAIVFLVDDCNGALISLFKKQYLHGVCLFELRGQHLFDFESKSYLSKWCFEFIRSITEWESREDLRFGNFCFATDKKEPFIPKLLRP